MRRRASHGAESGDDDVVAGHETENRRGMPAAQARSRRDPESRSASPRDPPPMESVCRGLVRGRQERSQACAAAFRRRARGMWLDPSNMVAGSSFWVDPKENYKNNVEGGA